jgi:hypothetical protein
MTQALYAHMNNKRKRKKNFFVWDCTVEKKQNEKFLFLILSHTTYLVISATFERGPSLAWPASPTCLWKASWSVAHE